MGDAPARLRKAVSSGNVVPGRREGPGPGGLTLAGVLFELLLILLHCGHTAVVNQLAQALQVSHGLIYQLGIACYALQPGDGQTRDTSRTRARSSVPRDTTWSHVSLLLHTLFSIFLNRSLRIPDKNPVTRRADCPRLIVRN